MNDIALIEQSIEDRTNELTVPNPGTRSAFQSGQSASWTTDGQPD